MFFLLLSFKGFKHGKVDQKVHSLKFQILNMVFFNINKKKNSKLLTSLIIKLALILPLSFDELNTKF
jgi:hypothetical protein